LLSAVAGLACRTALAMTAVQRSRRIVGLMLCCCLLPVLAAWLSYRYFPPAGGQSVGQLLPTRPFAAASMPGWPQGRWVLVGRVHGLCGSTCRQRLFAMQQIHLAQGEAAARLRRVLLLDGASERASGGLQLLQAGPQALHLREDGFYLVDPLGNQVLFYADGAPPRKVIDELSQLLRINNGLG